jgi:hypothetical protein
VISAARSLSWLIRAIRSRYFAQLPATHKASSYEIDGSRPG